MVGGLSPLAAQQEYPEFCGVRVVGTAGDQRHDHERGVNTEKEMHFGADSDKIEYVTAFARCGSRVTRALGM